MLSINTNIASLIAQNSLTTSTDKLNQAIERMTTGFKINHASDNAANYSISTNLTTQLSAYDTAADNVAMGMDLVGYASDIISQMQDKAARLNALSTQARNGTYGAQSLSALNSEASAIMAEITRLYNTAEYNDISLFNKKEYTIAPHLPKAGASGFIDETALISMAAAGDGAGIAAGEVVGTTTDAPKAKAEYNGFIEDPKHPNGDAYVDGLTSVTEALAAGSLTSGGEYKVGGVEDLKALATYVNGGNDTSGMTFIMSEDIDLSGEANWTPIGDYSTDTSCIFKGSFDGNGHVIKNLKIDRETSGYQGLFGYADGEEIKNVGLEGVNIKGANRVGGLVGDSTSSISNSYATGAVTGQDFSVGGLVGSSDSSISNSYVTGSVSGRSDVGGLVGSSASSASSISNSYVTGTVTGTSFVGGLVGNSESSITNSYATGYVSGTGNYVGGLVGNSYSTISNSYATGAVSGIDVVGGLVGFTEASISNSYATGAVSSGTGDSVGGLVGFTQASISNSYATGNISGQGTYVGGLVGYTENSINNSYATGNVSGNNNVGGLVGRLHGNSIITNSYATGDVTGQNCVGGLAGGTNSSSTISNSYATGAVSGIGTVGGLVGYSSSSISNSYATGDVVGKDYVGGLIGHNTGSVNNCYATGNVYADASSRRPVGGLIGQNAGSLNNCYATGSVSGQNSVGGLVGSSSTSSSISNSYATGDVTGQGAVGGLVGYYSSSISNSYATGLVTGQSHVGGLVGQVYAPSGTYEITNSASYSIVSGTDSTSTGSLIGGAVMTANGSDYGTLNITNTQSIAQEGMNSIGGAYYRNVLMPDYNLDAMLENIQNVAITKTSTNLQVGIYSNSSSQLNFDTNFSFDLNIDAGIESVDSFNAIVAFENLLSDKATMLGAVQNRLDSALESIEVNINNLASTRSTIRDADIAEVSSEYIKQQILQQASATLMATANQSPAIALQLI